MSQVAYHKFNVGGKDKYMKFDYNAVADIEDMYNDSLFNILSQERMGLRTIRVLYWAGLKWKEPKMTLAQAGNIVEELLVEGNSLEDITQPVYRALEKAKFIKALGIDFEEEAEEAGEGTEGTEGN